MATVTLDLTPPCTPTFEPTEPTLNSLSALSLKPLPPPPMTERKGDETPPSTPPRQPISLLGAKKVTPERVILRDRDSGVDTRVQKAFRRSKVKLREASSGSIGCTLFGSERAGKFFREEDLDTYGIDQNTPLDFVLKWVPNHMEETERLCTELARIYGMITPTMQVFSPKTSGLLVRPTKLALGGRKNKFNPKLFTMIAMNKVKGGNIVDLCRSRTVTTLSPNAWQLIMKEFGKAVIFDLFTGNDDRFIRFDTSDRRFSLQVNPTANSGNIMVHVTPKKTNVSEVAVIDNGTMANSHPRRALFGKQGKVKSLLSETSENSRRAATCENLHILFDELTLETEELASHAHQAIRNAFMKEMTGRASAEQIRAVSERIDGAKRFLNVGIQEGLQRLNDETFQKEALALVQDGDFGQLITRNIQLLALRKEHAQVAEF